uniref:VPS37 C-terminal domain-containing protein n=1 Tax=Physcomitrium patens TaxID=3218 RepID=A0A7I4B9H2_PHYPA
MNMLGVFSRGRQQQQQGQPPPTTQSWYPPSVAGPASSGRTRTPPPPPPNLGGRPSGAVKKAIFNYGPTFNNRSWCRPEELTLLLNDKDAYNSFLHSLDEVKRLDMISAELEKSTIYESKKNLAKESEIAELKTQCMIIKNTELADTKEKFEEVDKRYMEVQANSSPSAFLQELQVAANEVDEDSENLH